MGKIDQLQEMLSLHEIITRSGKIINSYKRAYFVEIDPKGDRYIVELNPWEMPVSSDPIELKLTAGNELTVRPVQTKTGKGLNINFRKVQFQMQDVTKHKIVQLDDCEAVVFREQSRWLMFLGSTSEDLSQNLKKVGNVMENMYPKRKARDTGSSLSF